VPGGQSIPARLRSRLVGVTGAGGTGRARRLAAAAVIAGLGIALDACGSSGTGLAQQACSHVNASIGLLTRSEHQTNPATGSILEQRAYLQLRAALPIAAQAAYHDGQWQSLMTTVAESSRVPESTLVDALQAQCRQADSSTFGQPAPPSSIPPPTSPGSTSP
jgi:hypothetical protein